MCPSPPKCYLFILEKIKKKRVVAVKRFNYPSSQFFFFFLGFPGSEFLFFITFFIFNLLVMIFLFLINLGDCLLYLFLVGCSPFF